MTKTLLSLLMFVTLTACATNDPPVNPATDRWGRVRFLVGTWEGSASGQRGNATVKRTYKVEVGREDEYIIERGTIRYEVTTPGRKPEILERLEIFIYDKARKTFMLHQSDSYPGSDVTSDEGHVSNVFALNSEKSLAKYLIFDSLSLDYCFGRPLTKSNAKAIQSYEVISPNEIIETFELSENGKDFVEYSRIHLKRKK